MNLVNQGIVGSTGTETFAKEPKLAKSFNLESRTSGPEDAY